MSSWWAALGGALLGALLAIGIFARRAAAWALAAHEARMERAMHAAHLGTWDWDIRADRMVWSDRRWAVSGLDRANTRLSGASFIATVHPDDRAGMQVAMYAALHDDAPFDVEARVLRPDGSTRWMVSHGHVLRDATGRAERMVGVDIDVTPLKRIEAELAESEARFRVAFDRAAIGMALTRADGTWFKVNRALCALLGYREEELLETSFASLTHPDEVEASVAILRRLMAGEADVVTLEKRYRHHDGHYVWALVSVAVVRDADQRPVYQVAQMQDIHARKLMEAELEGSEARFTTAFELAPIGMALVEPSGRWMKVNPALCELLGYSQSELLNLDFQGLSHPDEITETLTLVRQLHAGEIPQVHQEKRYRTKRGDYLWVRVSVSLVRDRDGCPLHHVTQVQNIDARRRAEANLLAAKQLAESREREKSQLLDRLNEAQRIAKIGSWSVDKPSGAMWWSDEMYRIFAVDPSSYIPSVRANVRYFHNDDRADYKRRIELAMVEDHKYEAEVRVVVADGSIKHISDHGHMERDANGHITRIYGTFQDVSERHQLEAQLREAQKMESLGALAGGVAHDFNNLLSVILGNAQLARMQCQDPLLLNEKLAHIEQAGQRAKGLVEQILAFSRRKPLSFVAVDIAQVARDAMHLLRATIPSGVAISATIPEQLPWVLADATQLHQVIMNLFTNAWHAVRGIDAREARVRLELRTQTLDLAATAMLGAGLDAGEYVCLSVLDNGVGMDAVTRARVFEPFFTTRITGEGTGLGLSVVHGIVSAHRGAINVESVPGAGTAFHIHLPVTRDIKEARHEPVLPATGTTSEVHGRVLYIDDEPAMVALVQELLSGDGVSVTTDTDAVHALRRLRAAPQDFDLVITDFNMPMHSGLDVAREVARLRADLPVVVSSGYITPELQEAADGALIEALVNKVETADCLAPLVREILARTAAAA